MLKIGIIYSALNLEEYVSVSLGPWIDARNKKLGGHEWYICAVSVPFENFDTGPMDGTQVLLNEHYNHGDIDHLIRSETPMKETESRGAALTWLKDKGVDYIWQADGDEMPTQSQISAIIKFVESRPNVDWFRLSLKNIVFALNQHLVEPFTPARIHKIFNAGGFVASGFHDDNNVYYERPWNKERILDKEMASLTIPKTIAWIKHLSWLSDERSKRKVAYQSKRGWNCSFAWDDSLGLVWNEEFFKKTGQSIPEIAQD